MNGQLYIVEGISGFWKKVAFHWEIMMSEMFTDRNGY
jgi:hypothetical protein